MRVRIVNLWNLLLVADPRGMIDIKMSQVARVVGSSEEYARHVWAELMRGEGRNDV